jgi:hypothetical protein
LELLTYAFSVAVQHVTSSGESQTHIELWQAINLIGAPLLAVLFARPVVEDLKSWWAARRATHLE